MHFKRQKSINIEKRQERDLKKRIDLIDERTGEKDKVNQQVFEIIVFHYW